MTSFMPVALMNTSPTAAASSIFITRWPLSTAFRAAVGLTSVAMTLAPMPSARMAQPAPQWP